MKSSLVLVVLHVLNGLVVLNANKTNTSSCSWASGQTHFNQHGNMNILLISRDMFLKHSANYIWKLEMWKYDQSLQIYNNVASASSLQISDIESMPSENEIIRVLQSNFVTSSNQSKSNFNTKLLIINTCTFTNKFTFKQAAFRYIIMIGRIKKKMIMKKKKEDYWRVLIVCIVYVFYFKRVFFKKNKNNRLLKNCKVVLMISTPSFNRSCNIENRVWIGNVVCDGTTNKKTATNITCSHDRFIFKVLLSNSSEFQYQNCSKPNFTSKSHCSTSPVVLSNAAMLSPFSTFFCLKNKQTNKKNKLDCATTHCRC
ncbi:hypothetical protein RFI_36650 [Reticulomyxa filosa]|uniref:Uncharacterized protein n=1 Tax=Reticulomyxa filosa TaxID=46433 RepID=X6LJ97_RETFI|nr:hypothetical protein RFI_36650 [Reticulomyxa filosa]|eukprot:ETO00790.1 hypothetical protein RFI_36650 [Reticulomyxa filosa]